MHKKKKAIRNIFPEEAEELRRQGLVFKLVNPDFIKQNQISKDGKEICKKHRISKILYTRLKQAYDKNGLEGVFNILRRRGFKRTEWNEIGKMFEDF